MRAKAISVTLKGKNGENRNEKQSTRFSKNGGQQHGGSNTAHVNYGVTVMYSFVVSVNSILRGREYRQAREKAKKKPRSAFGIWIPAHSACAQGRLGAGMTAGGIGVQKKTEDGGRTTDCCLLSSVFCLLSSVLCLPGFLPIRLTLRAGLAQE